MEDIKLPERQLSKLSSSCTVDLQLTAKTETCSSYSTEEDKNTLQLPFFNLPKLAHPGSC